MEYKECKKCPGYCCISDDTLRTPLTNDDINRIAAHLKIPFDRFMREFVVSTRGKMQYDNAPNAIAHIKTLGPCPFLRSGLCVINKVKPQMCKDAKPVHINDTVSCAEWHKNRLGGATKIKDVVIHAPTANASVRINTPDKDKE